MAEQCQPEPTIDHLIVFLEWLDSTREVVEWRDKNTTHEDVATRYLFSRAMNREGLSNE